MATFVVWVSLFSVHIGIEASAEVRTPMQVYTALRHEVLFTQLGYRKVRTALSARGVGYLLDGGDEVKNVDVILSVHPTIEEAKSMFQLHTLLIAVRSTTTDDKIGDDFRMWASRSQAGSSASPGGSMLIRFRNVVLGFRWDGTLTGALRLARGIEQLVESDRNIAPLGFLDQRPEISFVAIPTILAASTELRITPEVKGLGDSHEVLFAAEAERQWRNLSGHRLSKGHFVLQVPREEGLLKVQVIAASRDNVFVTKTVEVTVVPQDDK